VGVKVTTGAGIDLPHRDTGCGDPYGIIIGLLVTLYDGKAEFVPQVVQSTLEDRGLAGSRRTYQIQHENAATEKEVSVFPGQAVVLGQDIGFNGNFSGFFRLAVAVGVPMIMVLMVVVVFMIVRMIMVMVFWGTSAYGTHGSVNLHFFHPQLFTGQDGNLVAAAGGTTVIIGSQVEFFRAIVTLPHGRYPFDNQTRPLQKSALGASLKAELQRVRNNTAQLADLKDHRCHAPSAGVTLTDFNHTLGQGQFMHNSATLGKRKDIESCDGASRVML